MPLKHGAFFYAKVRIYQIGKNLNGRMRVEGTFFKKKILKKLFQKGG